MPRHTTGDQGWPVEGEILAVMGREVGAGPRRSSQARFGRRTAAAAEQDRRPPASEAPHRGGVKGTRVMANVGYRLGCLQRG